MFSGKTIWYDKKDSYFFDVTYTREYLAQAEKKGRVVNVSMELPKSFVVCSCPDGGVKVYISQISSGTLLKRTNYMDEISNVN